MPQKILILGKATIVLALTPWLLLTCVLLGPGVGLANAASRMQRMAEIPLPGPTGRFDYMVLDANKDSLLINQMGAGRVLVFNLHTQRLAGQVRGLTSPTGVTLAPALQLAFISDPGNLWDRIWGNGSVVAVNLRTLAVVHHYAAAGFPDGSAWVPGLNRLFVSNERGGKETVIGEKPLQVERNIDLRGEAGNSAFDAASGRVLVNVQTRDDIVAINPVTLTIERRIPLPATCQHNHGLLVDNASHLAFVACDGNAKLLTLALPSLRTLQVNRLGRSPDVLALDSRRRRLWVASESGVVSVFNVTDRGLLPLWRGRVGPDAHTVAIDPATGWAWFPLANVNGHPLLRAMRLKTP